VRHKKIARQIDERIRETQELIDAMRVKFEGDRKVSDEKLKRLLEYQAQHAI